MSVQSETPLRFDLTKGILSRQKSGPVLPFGPEMNPQTSPRGVGFLSPPPERRGEGTPLVKRLGGLFLV